MQSTSKLLNISHLQTSSHQLVNQVNYNHKSFKPVLERYIPEGIAGLQHHQPLEPILSAQSVESSQENSVKQLDDSSNGDRYITYLFYNL